MDAILQSISKHQAALAETTKVNKQTIFDALAARGFTRINVTFDGEGDSGQIDNLAGFVGDVLTKLPDVTLMLQQTDWTGGQVAGRESTLPAAIEQLCYDYLEQEHDGWENNDGAFGEFILDVAGRTVELEFNGRFTDVFTSSHTF
jgi:hypothetical protein